MSLILFQEKDKNTDQDRIKFLFRFTQMEEFKAEDGVISGTAVPYNEQTQDWRKLQFAPKAFKKINKVSAFINHDNYDVLSMVGAAEFFDSPKSLKFKIKLNLKDPDVVNKIIPLIQMGALEGVSIGAFIYKKEIETDEDGEFISVTVTEAEIYEISLVTFQAFENAKIEANKKGATNMKTKQELEAEARKIKLEKEAKTKANAEKAELERIELANAGKPAGPKPSEESASPEPVDEEEQLSTEEQKTLKEELKKKTDEIEQLKKEKTDEAKKIVVNKLIASGIVHKSQTDRILKSFKSAEAITEFYKDVPASYSVKPKGEGAVDTTTEEIKAETYKRIASETSLSEEDLVKYNK